MFVQYSRIGQTLAYTRAVKKNDMSANSSEQLTHDQAGIARIFTENEKMRAQINTMAAETSKINSENKG